MTATASGGGAPSYWRLVGAGEPFRVLFPLGALLGIAGVMAWPLHVWGFLAAYPGQAHARVMVEGFLSAFVMGFLGTALPRLMDVPRVKLAETAGLALALAFVSALHLSGSGLWGDGLFVVTFAAFVGGLSWRARSRKDTPPPSFVLVVLGLLAALLGAASQIADRIWPTLLVGWPGLFGRSLLHQAYVLLPVMGVGAFLLPRFFGLPGRQSFPDGLALPPGWLPRAVFAFLAGALVLFSFFLQAAGHDRTGYVLRAAAVAAYFFREVPVHQAARGGGTLALGLRIALVAIPAGYLLMAAWASHDLALLHIVFISGFGLLVFIVGCRVVFGHSGQSDKFRSRLWPVLAVIFLVLLAMLTRVTADWMPATRLNHYAYAAVAWVAAALVWLAAIRSGLAKAED